MFPLLRRHRAPSSSLSSRAWALRVKTQVSTLVRASVVEVHHCFSLGGNALEVWSSDSSRWHGLLHGFIVGQASAQPRCWCASRSGGSFGDLLRIWCCCLWSFGQQSRQLDWFTVSGQCGCQSGGSVRACRCCLGCFGDNVIESIGAWPPCQYGSRSSVFEIRGYVVEYCFYPLGCRVVGSIGA